MDKFVYIKSAETMQGKSAKYLKVLDQDGVAWNIFEQTPIPQIGKTYIFSFEKNGEWNNITGIKPLVNVFQQKAVKEVANRNDFKRDFSIAVSYSIQLVAADKIPLDKLFVYADQIYDAFQEKADQGMAKLEEK
jgi:hypothetical protein